ncbi:MAG: TatD family hydrolase [Patescibacteria group bacterium]
MNPQFFDIHAHVNDVRFKDDEAEVVARMLAARVSGIMVGTDLAMSRAAITLAEKYAHVWATIGCHPVDNTKEIFDDAVYQKMAEHPRVVAIGECGLDYYWPADAGWVNSESVEKKRQTELFKRQIAIAVAVDKPLMIHGRPTKGNMDAYEDILTILKEAKKEHGNRVRGNIHFFVGTLPIAEQFFALDFTISFTGVITFARDYDEVIRRAPLDRIMSETDAPYVAPIPHRGKRNEPIFVEEVVKKIAEIRGEDFETVRKALVVNAERVFSVNKS